MESLIVGISISILAVMAYTYVFLQVRQAQRFLTSVIPAADFYRRVSAYEGYVICVGAENIDQEAPLFSKIAQMVNQEGRCTVVAFDLSQDGTTLDWQLLQQMQLSSIPSIFYVDHETNIKELIRFESFFENDDITDKNIVEKIRLRLKEV